MEQLVLHSRAVAYLPHSCSLPQGWPSLTSLLSRSTPPSPRLYQLLNGALCQPGLWVAAFGGCLLVPKDSFPEKPAHGQD